MVYICSGFFQKRGDSITVPSFFKIMAELIEKVYGYLEPLLEGTDIFVVNIKVKPINNIKIYLDADSGLSIDKCTMVNRKLYHRMEEEQLFPAGDFSLEVSSPGVDEPLMQVRQYRKNIGRTVTITDGEGIEKTGVLRDVTDDHIVLEVRGKKTKDPVIASEVPFSIIKKTVVQIIF